MSNRPDTPRVASDLPPLGSKWVEKDNRFKRIVEVIPGWDEKADKIRIRNTENDRITWASVKRFNGKHGGYERLL